jgi:hypothetical protein
MSTPLYASVNLTDYSADVAHSGTSSTSTDAIELRMGSTTYVPTRMEVIKGVETILRWIQNGGTDGAGANLPNPTQST